MTKVIKKKAKDLTREITPAISYSLTQLYYEMDTIKMQMATFSDADLIDFIVSHIDMYSHSGMDKLYDKIACGDNLAPEERKEVEAFCILANTEMVIKA